MRVVLVELGPSRPELHEPIGIETIATWIGKRIACIELGVVSQSFDSSALKNVSGGDWDVIGLGAKMGTWDRLLGLCRQVLARNRSAVIVIGDLLATYAWREVLEQIPEAICVRGEGEEVFPEILRRYQLHGNGPAFRFALASVPNLAFRRGAAIVETTRGATDISLASPPARPFLKSAVERQAQVQLEASRGCPWSRCSFCSIPDLNGVAWRPFPVEVIIEQLREISDAGAISPYFTDSDFLGASIDRAMIVAGRISEEKDKGRINRAMNFYFNLQVTGILGGAGNEATACDKFLKAFKAAGLREVFVGIESGAKDQVLRYAKASTAARNLMALRKLRDFDIDSDVGFIMFDPDMLLREVAANLDFLKAADLWTHPSRLTKALRIQPDTGYAESFFSTKRPSLNVNNLSYPYRFKDQAVDEVYRHFRCWEVPHLDYATLVQGASKGEVAGEAERRELRLYLGALRAIDLDYLQLCVTAAGEGSLKGGAFGRVGSAINSEWLGLVSRRPSSVDIYAERLGIELCASGIIRSTWYDAQYRVLNGYEDPVYGSILEMSRLSPAA